MYYFSMLLVIISSLFYHIAQKTISPKANPAVSMIATYGVALVLSIILYFIYPKKEGALLLLKDLNISSYMLGAAIVVLEIGYLLVYRSGWNISYAGVFANVLIGILMIPIGLYFYKEHLSLVNVFGIIICLIGIILIKK